MTQILIKNGIVYDPLNNINGEEMDIGVKYGKIVDPSKIDINKAVVVDAKGKIVVSGGIDIHSHIAGPKVNIGRLIRPEDHYLTNIPHKLPYRRAETGLTVPNVFKIGYEYARMGYTFVAEPATPPIKTRHTHEELNSIPIIDKMAFVLVDSNWILLDLIQEGLRDILSAYLGWLLYATKTYALKIVDAGSDMAWMVKGIGLDIDDQLPGYNLTPRDIIKSVAESAQLLNVPHKVHVHCNRLGYPGNYLTTIKTIGLTGAITRVSEEPALHITHVQFTGYKGDSWNTLESGGEYIAKELNANPYVTLDIGQVIPGRPATTMTADAPFEFVLYHLTRWKWSTTDTEIEASSGVVPYKYRKKSYVNTIQWAIGLEVILLAKDLWRVFLTTDHPNGGPFVDYPILISWLMSRKARDDFMKQLNKKALKRCVLPSIDRELNLYEIIAMTRSYPAKLFGLDKIKGHLGEGADADIAIYDINPREIDFSRDYEKVVKAFRKTYMTIKDGEIVVKNGEIVKTIYGKNFYVKPEIPEDITKELYEKLKLMFKQYYSIALENFIIDKRELKNPMEITIKTYLR
ncbi:MAG: formylmethanofuran dehydrogenase subunit A [Candidatus Methanomethylicia archaeon]|nr:formylmethanofuran dehydrogenase subunit A [Candidatus Methanomethylicia archaeon]MCX8168904.1 formylmethanofuran dehydrogenase subunit A [Candidatus Methanomethylicia archaeon]MDW7988636.1 formylmethanofuran dehydrogenase subunit A [Nitrososphaerota archaeon]